MIAILGGGVMGLSVARSLALRGRQDVVVFDPREPGAGSTARAMGGFRLQHGSRINFELASASRPWFEERAQQVEFSPVGYLYLAETVAAERELAVRAGYQREWGVPVESVDPGPLVPFLAADDLLAANFCALDGVYSPPKILETVRSEALAGGTQLRYGWGASAAELASAAAIVVAAGAWSWAVGASLGVRLDVQPLERALWWYGPFEWLAGLRVPMTLEVGSGYHLREREGHLVVTGPGDQRDPSHFTEWLWRRVPRTRGCEPVEGWFGNYEMTPDHHALIGATERPGVFACCGFSGHGVMQSPAAGDSLAALLLDEVPPVDISSLSPLRTEALVDRTQL